jgi:hypothetical protein
MFIIKKRSIEVKVSMATFTFRISQKEAIIRPFIMRHVIQGVHRYTVMIMMMRLLLFFEGNGSIERSLIIIAFNI